MTDDVLNTIKGELIRNLENAKQIIDEIRKDGTNDIAFDLLVMILNLSTRIEKLEEVVFKENHETQGNADKCSKSYSDNCNCWNGDESSLRAEFERHKKDMEEKLASHEKERLEEYEKLKEAELERLKTELRSLEAEAVRLGDLRALPMPNFGNGHSRYICACAPAWWKDLF